MSKTPESSPVSEHDYARLETFAEKNLQSADGSELIAEMPPALQRGAIYFVALALAATLCLLYFGRIHIVVDAKGKIIPEGDVLIVQALQSGVVNAVLAKAGDRLPAGAPILRIDVSESGINLAESKAKYEVQKSQLDAIAAAVGHIDRILIESAHKPAEQHDRSVPPVGNVVQLINALENATMKLQTATRDLGRLPERRQLQTKEIELTSERIQLLNKNQQNEVSALARQESALTQKKEQLASFRRLADNNLISSIELSGEEEKFRTAEGALIAGRQRFDQQAIEISNQELRQAELATKLQTEQAEIESGYRSAQVAYAQSLTSLRQERENLKTQAREIESTLQTSRQRIEMAESRMSLAVISLPAAGTIVELKVRNAGELLAAGAVVATLAPSGVPLMVEAEIPNRDIGFVKPGLQARIKVDAYPFQQFGTVAAEVSHVLPASGANNNFAVRLRLLENKLVVPGNEVFLFPGLTVQADLLTSRQRLLNLLFAPASSNKTGTP